MFALGALELILLVLVVLVALRHLQVPHRGRWTLVILVAAALAWLRPTFLVGWISPRTLATLSAGIVLGLLIFSRRAGGAIAGILLLLLAAGLFWYLAVDRTPTTEPAATWRREVDRWAHENIGQPMQEAWQEVRQEIRTEIENELPALRPLFELKDSYQAATRFELKFRHADLVAHQVTAEELATALWNVMDQVARAPSPDRAEVQALEATIVAHRADGPLQLAQLADLVRSTRRDPQLNTKNFRLLLQSDNPAAGKMLIDEVLLELEHAQFDLPIEERPLHALPIDNNTPGGEWCGDLLVLPQGLVGWDRTKNPPLTLLAQASEASPVPATDLPPPAVAAPADAAPAVAATPQSDAPDAPSTAPSNSSPATAAAPPASPAPSAAPAVPPVSAPPVVPDAPAAPPPPAPSAAPEAAASPIPPVPPVPPVAPLPPTPPQPQLDLARDIPAEPGRRLNVRRSHPAPRSTAPRETRPSPAEPVRSDFKRLTERPAWIDEPPPRTGQVFYLTGQEGPFATVEECEEVLPALAERLAQRYVRMLYRHAPAETATAELSFHNLLSLGVVREYYIEPVDSPSLGRMHQLRLLTAFDERTRSWIDRRLLAHETHARMITVGTGAALICALLATVLAYLKLDTATRGYYSRRLQFGAAALMTAAVALAVVVWTR